MHIGLTAANKQAPLLVHADCKVNIPDHDFVIAKQHKLVPSLIGDMKMKAKIFSSDAFTYSRPFFIGIWSAKHLGSSAYNHITNMKRKRQLPKFERSFKNSQNEEKSVMILSVNGGRDEKP